MTANFGEEGRNRPADMATSFVLHSSDLVRHLNQSAMEGRRAYTHLHTPFCIEGNHHLKFDEPSKCY